MFAHLAILSPSRQLNLDQTKESQFLNEEETQTRLADWQADHVSIHKHAQKGLWSEPSEVRSNPALTLTVPLKPIVQS